MNAPVHEMLTKSGCFFAVRAAGAAQDDPFKFSGQGKAAVCRVATQMLKVKQVIFLHFVFIIVIQGLHCPAGDLGPADLSIS